MADPNVLNEEVPGAFRSASGPAIGRAPQGPKGRRRGRRFWATFVLSFFAGLLLLGLFANIFLVGYFLIFPAILLVVAVAGWLARGKGSIEPLPPGAGSTSGSDVGPAADAGRDGGRGRHRGIASGLFAGFFSSWAVALVVLLLLGLVLVPCGCPSRSATISLAPAFSSSTGSGTCGAGVATYNVTLNPSSTISTSMFGMTMTAASGATLAIAAPISNGAAPNLVATLGAGCGAGTGSAWYGLLWGPSVLWTSPVVPIAVYGTGGTNGWTALIGATLPVTVVNGMQLEIITSNSTASTDLFFCVGINGNSVTGSTTL